MITIDDRLDQAGAELRATTAMLDVPVPPTQRRPSSPVRFASATTLMAVLILITVGVGIGVTTSREPDSHTAAASPSVEAGRLEAVIDAVGRLGYVVRDVGEIPHVQREDYWEWLLTLDDGTTLLVSVNISVPDKDVPRGDPLVTVGSASVYLGTDGPAATAVELVDGRRVVYVRSEVVTATESGPIPTSELATLTVSLNDAWRSN